MDSTPSPGTGLAESFPSLFPTAVRDGCRRVRYIGAAQSDILQLCLSKSRRYLTARSASKRKDFNQLDRLNRQRRREAGMGTGNSKP